MRSRAVLQDLRLGLSRNGARFILVGFLFSVLNIDFYTMVNNMPIKSMNMQASAMDCWVHIMRGIEIYDPATKLPFRIPLYWLIIQAVMAFLVISYPTQDLFGYGSQLLFRVRKRNIWWISKCLWNSCTVLLFYGTGILLTCIYSLMFGKFHFEPTQGITLMFSGIDLRAISSLKIYTLAVILPILTSMALSMLQMTLSFILNPIFSYFFIICYVLIAAYYYSPYLIPNFSMVLRNGYITSSGFYISNAILLDIFVIISSALVGLIYFIRFDILKSKNGVIQNAN